MELDEKIIIKLKIALVFKRIIESNKKRLEDLVEAPKFKEQNLITSYRKWEAASGVPIASISEIMTGERTAAATTLVTLITSLGLNMEFFGHEFDSINEVEVKAFYKELIKSRSKEKK